ncbi:MAG: hypothetical protein IJS22_03445 [Lachnospiraceae bacterium]|nr:hypothetical protein [Lachnospiraceae bacterium]
MKLSPLQDINMTRELTDAFLGYNHNPRQENGEWFDMDGITGDAYPIARTREAYTTIPQDGGVFGLFAGEELVRVIDDTVYYGNSEISGTLPSSEEQQIVGMGAYICLFPAKVYFNYANPEDPAYRVLTSLAAHHTVQPTVSNPIKFTYVKSDMETAFVPASVKPDDPADGDYWMDTENKVLKQWSKTSAMWVSVPSSYIKIHCTGIGTGIKDYDGIQIKGIDRLSEEATQQKFWYVNKADNDNIVITYFLSDLSDITGTSDPVTIDRPIPDMDYVIQLNNRLWGCSSAHHEIYASKLGDPKNWYCYPGIASDSYAVTVGTEGEFTGMAVYLGKVYAFKENYIHKVYGTMPSNFQTTETACKGIAKGSARSAVVVDDYLYYLSTDGVCRFDGSLPAVISQDLGEDKLKDGCATFLGKKYYLFATVGNEGRLYVYNARYGFWHIESKKAERTVAVTYKDEVYTTNTGDSFIEKLSGGDSEVRWYLETGKILMTLPSSARQYSLHNKYISSIMLRMRAALGTRVQISISYDGKTEEPYKLITGDGNLNVIVMKFAPHRCDYIRLILEGTGQFELYSMSKTIEVGSEVR